MKKRNKPCRGHVAKGHARPGDEISIALGSNWLGKKLPNGLYLVILAHMKTAISLPDDLFAKAEALARKEGLSRSELYAKALADYIRRQERSGITEELNALVEKVGADAFRVDPVLAAHQACPLSREEW